MIVLIYVGFALAGSWRQVLTWDQCIGANAQLIVVTCVMRIIVVHLVLMIFVVGLTLVLVLGVLVALLGGVLALWPVRRTWLERLVAAIRRSLVLWFLLAFIIVATMTTVIAILPLVVVAMVPIALPVVATITPLTLFCCTADLFFEPLP
jgi:hypothetical protein